MLGGRFDGLPTGPTLETIPTMHVIPVKAPPAEVPSPPKTPSSRSLLSVVLASVICSGFAGLRACTKEKWLDQNTFLLRTSMICHHLYRTGNPISLSLDCSAR